MPVMGSVKFERLFRAAGRVTAGRDDVNRYLDFVNDAIYDLMVIGRATAKANVRDVIEPWHLPITKGLQESMHQFEKLEEEIELQFLPDKAIDLVDKACAMIRTGYADGELAVSYENQD